MRLALLILCLLNFSFSGRAQVSKIDSLTKLLVAEKADSSKVTLLWQLGEQYQSFKPDTALQIAQQALLLAQRIKFKEGESRSLGVLATSQYLLGNYPRALNNYMLKLKIEEKRNSPLNFSRALSNIGLMYILLEEYENALSYLYRADSTINTTDIKINKKEKYGITINIGEAYYRMNMPDSAGLYFKNALIQAKQADEKIYIGESILGMANVFALKEDNSEALRYYHLSLPYFKDGFNNDLLCEVAMGLAKIYEKLNFHDSAVYFGRTAFTVSKRDGFLSRELDAAYFLSQYFKKWEIYDSAYKYSEITSNLKDSIKGQEKTREAMIISTNEQLRQAELAEQKRKEKATRSQQLQLLIIAICIPIFFLMTLVISRIKIHVTIIRFMCIISLLLLFEFLLLLLHPFVANLTNHIPLLELLIFVCVAAGLIPLHHRLEHLLVSKLTKGKNQGAADHFKPKTLKIKLKN